MEENIEGKEVKRDSERDIVAKLGNEISSDVGNSYQDELESISKSFNTTLANALKVFNSSTFDETGFVKKIQDFNIGDGRDKDIVKNIMNNLKHEYIDVNALNHSELLLRRDMYNICVQMPEMRDVIYVIRDAIIECNVSTGKVSRSLTFENNEKEETYEAYAKEIENKHNLLMSIKNFIVPRTLMIGEMYIHVIPYSKLFAELDAIKRLRTDAGFIKSGGIKEAVNPSPYVMPSKSLYSEDNLKYIMESVGEITRVDGTDSYRMEHNSLNSIRPEFISKEYMSLLLKNINVCNKTSLMMEEMGPEGLHEFVMAEYKKSGYSEKRETSFTETLRSGNRVLGRVPDEEIHEKEYEHIKGCYVKYLDGLRMVPIRMDRKVIGYYYISTTMDLQVNPGQPNGIVDLSFQHYTRDKNLVDRLATLIIKSFDKKILEKNIQLKDEIAEIIMAHHFSEGRLSFIYIPEDEIVRLYINEDESGKGHSVIEPSLFPARMYLLLTLYNMIYILNNNTTRIHYLRSSGLNKDYAAQVQRAIRKFQSRRITIDDIYSYSGVLNKVGGMGEMVLPLGRGELKALETDTLEGAQLPINLEFLETKRREALAGTGVPHNMIHNAIDEFDFAKTAELANTRFLSTVSAYKIDFNDGLTRLYQKLLKHSTDLEDSIISSFRYQFNDVKQQDLNITNEMIANFNTVVETVSTLYYDKDEMEADGKPTAKAKFLKKELAKVYLPQLDFDKLDEIVGKVNLANVDDLLQKKVSALDITKDEVEEVEEEK
jgi:hypothetical protein